MGIVTHPYNQVIQEYNEMDALQKEFTTLTAINQPEKIQMIVRVGRAESTYKSWRKMPEDYLIRK
jgi:predicted AlkP superfamily phosphohydrolase/phosphomutase